MNKQLDKFISGLLIVVLQLLTPMLCAQELSLMMSKQEISCNGSTDGKASVFPSGGEAPYQYLWSNGETSQTILDIGPGTYEVTVTDANGLQGQNATGLLEIEPLALELIVTDGKCGKLGQIEAILSGGLGPFQYLWSDGSFGRQIKELEQGTYSLTITDRNACPIVESAGVLVFDDLILSTDFVVPTCFGGDDGYISVSQTGGQQPVEYLWNDGSTETSIENLSAGTYSIFAVDAFGCTNGLVIQLDDIDELKVKLVEQNNSLYAEVEGGTPSYDYSWSNGVTGSAVISNLNSGEYGITVEDAKGCIADAKGEVLDPLNTGNIESLRSFALTPTLVTNDLALEIVLDNAQNVNYDIYSSNGFMILTSTSSESEARISFPNVKKLASGVYYVKVSSDQGWTFTDRFIKL